MELTAKLPGQRKRVPIGECGDVICMIKYLQCSLPDFKYQLLFYGRQFMLSSNFSYTFLQCHQKDPCLPLQPTMFDNPHERTSPIRIRRPV